MFEFQAPPQFRSPEVADPVQAAGQMISLRNMQRQEQQQQRLDPLVFQQQQAATQHAKIQADRAQQVQNSLDTRAKTFNEAGGDQAKWRALSIERGVLPEHIDEMDKHALDIAKSKEDLSDAQNKTEAYRFNQARNQMAAFSEKSPEEKEAQWTNFLKGMHSTKMADGRPLMTDDEYLQTQKMYGDKYPGDTEFTTLMNGHANYASILSEREHKQSTEALAEQRTAAATLREQQTKELQNSQFIRDLTSSRNLNQWNQKLIDAGLPMDAYGNPPFDPATGQPTKDTATTMKQIVHDSLLGKDKVTADYNETKAAEIALRDRELAETRRMTAQAALNRAANAGTATATTRKAVPIASKLLADNGGDYDAAIEAAADTEDDKEKALLSETLKVLRSGKALALKNDEIQSRTDKNGRTGTGGVDAQVRNFLGGGSTPAPGATPTAKKGAGKGIIVQPGDGSAPHSFPDEASARKFEALVKKAGGTTSRQ